MWLLLLLLALVAALVAAAFFVDFSKHTPPVDIDALESRVSEQDKAVEPFTIAVPQHLLDDLADRLSRTRYPPAQDGVEWQAGADKEYIQELAEHWRTSYQWRHHEAVLNEWAHYKTLIDDVDLHFIHEPSSQPDATPLLLVHGWPGSFYEFYKVIGPLAEPQKHGAPPSTPAFHVVVPSLPGYAFSSAYTRHGKGDVHQVAITLARLMNRLGYKKYMVQGGDWGGLIGSYIPIIDRHCYAAHLNFLVSQPRNLKELGKALFTALFGTAKEKENIKSSQEFVRNGSGYSAIQRTKPQTLGFGLSDSPVGLLAWIGEKFFEWGHTNGHMENSFTKNEVLTNVMLYWLTNSITSSTRLYYETEKAGRWGGIHGKVEVPVAAACFPQEIVRLPRRMLEDTYNIVRWTEFSHGGHFAALEQPNELVRDIQAFASDLAAGRS